MSGVPRPPVIGDIGRWRRESGPEVSLAAPTVPTALVTQGTRGDARTLYARVHRASPATCLSRPAVPASGLATCRARAVRLSAAMMPAAPSSASSTSPSDASSSSFEAPSVTPPARAPGPPPRRCAASAPSARLAPGDSVHPFGLKNDKY
eukprot:CAMPEP_0206016876 /NCGR_PEP_ID=MMETSP1464-20131121/23784_1 /ASSEMBLY_ACC=CAM_ASM_001124 /TAXON_ID=119497 /ORGANISM="Exanthemachrysis gayraliae, Strain RCC1523" /LENGTH=149 /DNA_ID=CAMNT_0053390705 /DNA_START=180 /DNA_END=628 /DNA_ORIENTATION=+